MQDGIAGAVNTNCTCENKLAQIGQKSQHACFFFNNVKKRKIMLFLNFGHTGTQYSEAKG